jgi:hypothetical protein
MYTRHASLNSFATLSRDVRTFAPRMRVTERRAQNPRSGRIVKLGRNGLALVAWTDGTSSHQTTFNLVRAGDC